MRRLLLLAPGLLLFLLPGCTPDEAAPACYSGVVIGTTCYDGVLIEVDAPYRIGKPIPYGFSTYDSTGATNQNVLGALNSNELAAFNQRGQRIYFTCTSNTQGFSNFGACNAMGIQMPIPHVVLTSFSATPCTATQPTTR